MTNSFPSFPSLPSFLSLPFSSFPFYFINFYFISSYFNLIPTVKIHGSTPAELAGTAAQASLADTSGTAQQPPFTASHSRSLEATAVFPLPPRAADVPTCTEAA